MRIVHVAPSFCRRDGGPSEVLRGLLPAQASRGHDIALVTTDKGLSEEERSEPPIVAGLNVVPFTGGPYSLTYSAGLRGTVKDALVDADIVHVHGVDTYPSLVGMQEAARADVPFVLQPHGAWSFYARGNGVFRKRLWGLLLQDRLVRSASTVVVSSSRERAGVEAVFPRLSTSVIALGVDPGLFDIEVPWDRRDGVLSIGRLAAVKRVDLVLDAVARVNQTGVAAPVVIAGPLDSDLRFDPSARAIELGIGGITALPGAISKRERRELLGRSRVFICASEDESFGMAVAEAAAAGLAVVGTASIGALADAVEAGAATASTADPSELAQAILNALDDEGERQAQKLRAYARGNWTWERAAKRLDRVYAGALA